MADVDIYHPVTGGHAEVPESAVSVWQRSGWVRLIDTWGSEPMAADPIGGWLVDSGSGYAS